MIRTQIQLTEEQVRALRRLAHERQTSVAALMRDAAQDLIDGSERERVIDVALRAVGGYRSGRSDVAVRHDDYLADVIES
jgi:ribbon-helix-helix CopG family protein